MNKPSGAASSLAFQSRVIPVIVITHPNQAVPLAHALLAGGIDVMEITLRHAAGLHGIEAVAREVPAMHVGAGTVTQATEMRQVREAGATFALSPGLTPELHQAAQDQGMPFMPGVMTPSEAMRARDWGYRTVKLFPAAQAGGLSMVKAMAGPLADIMLCPTGGVSAANLAEFLSQPNVAMVGGSWLAPLSLLEAADWLAITRLACEACAVAQSVNP
ncbi:MAG: bifunctional 4-hydroxy-2-oxoglutarate aldolase/2-dehydro-3-deoxy-phosphogluconate aldolase [Alphaproteobacteria bacterium]|nr:bifunctional 4-hydroxy-2-oxoglutarate aldolase/2-dehydro-3-deoxy-phosphogluconate aldolase [Alphaproteobacteria bacterium]